jgi:mannitol operon repressor
MKKEPELEQLGEFLNYFNKESDRGAALLASALLEERLYEIILAFFSTNSTSKEMLNGYNAPLGSFSSRINIAFALSLIQRNEFKELHSIRKIRNEFGHDWRKKDFNHEIIKPLCESLPWLGPSDLEEKSTLRERFNFAVAILLVDLLWRARIVKNEEKRKSRIWPNKLRKP